MEDEDPSATHPKVSAVRHVRGVSASVKRAFEMIMASERAMFMSAHMTECQGDSCVRRHKTESKLKTIKKQGTTDTKSSSSLCHQPNTLRASSDSESVDVINVDLPFLHKSALLL